MREKSSLGRQFLTLSFIVLIGWVLYKHPSYLAQAEATIDTTTTSLVAHLTQTAPSLALLPSNGSDIRGKPSISVDLMNSVLEGSPAHGTGQQLYDLGVQYGIDPVYALAFFKHESSFGTAGVARVTHSLGNIRCAEYSYCIEGYRAYKSWVEGYEAWYRLIAYEYIPRGLTTPETIIPVYAPSSDHNDVEAYINAINASVSKWRNA